MPINTRHPDYLVREPQWKRCRDADGGQDPVKAAGEEYLPRLGGQDQTQYDAYKKRGLYLEAFGRTVQGLSGAVFRKDPVFDHRESPEIEDFLEDVTGDQQPLIRFAQRALNENLKTGWIGIRVTMDPDPSTENRPRLVLVEAESIINWADDGSWIILEEKILEADPEDPFARKEVLQWRRLYIDALGQYQVALWRENEQAAVADGGEKFILVEEFTPLRLGEPLTEIPFWVISGNQRSRTPGKPPLLGLADASFDHYRMMTDYRHGLHFTALPTPWFAGFNRKDAILIGSETAIVSENANAKAGMLEFAGQGLNPLKDAIEAVMQYMAALGARLLEQTKKVAEAAETHKIRAAAEQTTIQSIAKTTGETLSEVVQVALWWGNMQDDTFTMTMNTDLIDAEVDVNLLKQLSADLMAGHISYETYYHNLETAELTRPNVTAEAEQALIGEVEDDTFADAAG